MGRAPGAARQFGAVGSRAYLYGAMANGEAGVDQVIEIMRREFENGMALTGAANISEVRENGARMRSK